MIFAFLIGAITIMTLSIIFFSIASKRIDKHEEKCKQINIDKWKDMNVINMELKKRKAILERKVIQIILQEDDAEEILETEM